MTINESDIQYPRLSDGSFGSIQYGVMVTALDLEKQLS